MTNILARRISTILHSQMVDLVSTDNSPQALAAAAVMPMACNHVTVKQCEQALQHVVEHSILPKACLVALLEEGLKQLISNASIISTYATTTSTKTQEQQEQHPPLYYTTSPKAYLHPPTTTTQTHSSTTTEQDGYTPHVLVQRIKAGCALAYMYNSSWQAYHSQQTSYYYK